MKVNKMDSFLISDGVLKRYCGLEDSVVIPEGVEVIGSYSFSDHTRIKENALWTTDVFG